MYSCEEVYACDVWIMFMNMTMLIYVYLWVHFAHFVLMYVLVYFHVNLYVLLYL